MEKNKKKGLIVGNAYEKGGGKLTIKLSNKSLKELVAALTEHGESNLKGKTAEELKKADSIWLNVFPNRSEGFKASHVVIMYNAKDAE